MQSVEMGADSVGAPLNLNTEPELQVRALVTVQVTQQLETKGVSGQFLKCLSKCRPQFRDAVFRALIFCFKFLWKAE